MRGWAIALSLFLTCFLLEAQAQELHLDIRRQADRTLTLSAFPVGDRNGHTFIESSTNNFWFPAFYISSNSIGGGTFTVTNTGAFRLFKASKGQSVAGQVKASWDRLGVTNYVFHYTEWCICSIVSATVTVMSNTVVKIEDVRDREGNPVADAPLSIAPTINELLDAWIESEPTGGYARRLEFDSNGFPTFIDIDRALELADEELIFTIDRFTPLP